MIQIAEHGNTAGASTERAEDRARVPGARSRQGAGRSPPRPSPPPCLPSERTRSTAPPGQSDSTAGGVRDTWPHAPQESARARGCLLRPPPGCAHAAVTCSSQHRARRRSPRIFWLKRSHLCKVSLHRVCLFILGVKGHCMKGKKDVAL